MSLAVPQPRATAHERIGSHVDRIYGKEAHFTHDEARIALRCDLVAVMMALVHGQERVGPRICAPLTGHPTRRSQSGTIHGRYVCLQTIGAISTSRRATTLFLNQMRWGWLSFADSPGRATALWKIAMYDETIGSTCNERDHRP